MSDDKGFTLRAKDAAAIAAGIRQLKSTPRDLTGPRATGRLHSSDADIYIPIVNETGSVLPAGSVVRIGRQVVKRGRGGSEYPFKNYAWVATLPDDGLTGSYAVLQSTAQKGSTGRALLVGVAKVKLDDSEEGDYAKPVPNDFTKMKTGGDGYPVLGVEEPDSNNTWGFVLLMKGDADTKVAKFDGERTGKRYTGHIVKGDGTNEDFIQWLFLDDPGEEDIIEANTHVIVYKAPTWIANDESFGDEETHGKKYFADQRKRAESTSRLVSVSGGSGDTYTGTFVDDGPAGSCEFTIEYGGSETIFAAGKKVGVFKDSTGAYFAPFIRGTYFD